METWGTEAFRKHVLREAEPCPRKRGAPPCSTKASLGDAPAATMRAAASGRQYMMEARESAEENGVVNKPSRARLSEADPVVLTSVKILGRREKR
jgi:hypothetical protein